MWIECCGKGPIEKSWEKIQTIRVKKSHIIAWSVFYSQLRECWLIDILINKEEYTIYLKFSSKEKASKWGKYIIEGKK